MDLNVAKLLLEYHDKGIFDDADNYNLDHNPDKKIELSLSELLHKTYKYKNMAFSLGKTSYPLLYLCWYNKNIKYAEEYIQYLLSFDVVEINFNGGIVPPLIDLCEDDCNWTIVKLFLGRPDINVNIIDMMCGDTPMEAAVLGNSSKIIKLLLNHPSYQP
jgi:hypothetical protein